MAAGAPSGSGASSTTGGAWAQRRAPRHRAARRAGAKVVVMGRAATCRGASRARSKANLRGDRAAGKVRPTVAGLRAGLSPPPKIMAAPALPPGSRRAFLAGACASTLPALRARGVAVDDPEDMEAVARLLGLSFTAEERKQAKERLARQRDDYTALRSKPIAFDLSPCTT